MTYLDQKILRDIADIQRRIASMERSGQLGQIVIGNRFSTIATTSATGTKKVIQLKDNPTDTIVGYFAHVSYQPGSTPVRELRMTAVEAAGTDKNTYVTMDIRTLADTRIAFFQMSSTYVSGSLDNITLNFAQQGGAGVLQVVIDDTTNKVGYVTVGMRAGDPAGAPVGSMWYNTTTNTWRVRDNAGIHSI